MLYCAEFNYPASCDEERNTVHEENVTCKCDFLMSIVDVAGKVVDAAGYMFRLVACRFAFDAAKVGSKNVFCCDDILSIDRDIVDCFTINDSQHCLLGVVAHGGL